MEPYPNDHPAKKVLWGVIMPALEEAGYTGLKAFKALRDANHVLFHDGQCMFGPPEEDEG